MSRLWPIGYALLMLHLLIPGWAASVEALPAPSPIEVIEDLDQKFTSYHTGSELSAEELASNDTLKSEVLMEYYDIREFCRQALGEHWDERTPLEQEEFVYLMTGLLERKALFSKEHAKRQKSDAYQTRYIGEKYLDDDQTVALAKTQIVIPDERVSIDIDYQMKRNGSGWQIFDVIVDESSLLNNYRYQFNKIVTDASYDELVKVLEWRYEKLTGGAEDSSP